MSTPSAGRSTASRVGRDIDVWGWPVTRSTRLALVLALVLAGSRPALSGTLEYPHAGGHNIGCSACHDSPGSIPAGFGPYTPSNADDTPANNLCWSCHNDIEAPFVRTHSSLTTSGQYGAWSTECRTCHEPHEQVQATTYGLASYAYSGQAMEVGSSTLREPGAGWTPDEWAGWLVLGNVSVPGLTYRILENTADTLTVEGTLDPAITPGSPFAIVYGKLIRATITTPNSGAQTVRFFAPTGAHSFADGDATYDGVCEVCHTQTAHYRNDGSGSDQHHADVGGADGLRCVDCHSHQSGFGHGGGGGCGTASSCHGTQQSHPTHVGGGSGMTLDCSDCHDTNNMPAFADGQPLATTAACNTCHSPGGSYDGVNDPAIGAKNNWRTGVYSESALLPGREKWCAGCHDNSPSVVGGVTAPNIIGDEAGSYTYGTGWGYYKTGHGLPADATYTSKGGVLTLSGRPLNCNACHDFSAPHIDGVARTFDDGDSSTLDPSAYRQAYRLKLVDAGTGTGTSGREPLLVPWPAATGNVASNSRLCFDCHDSGPFLNASNMNTNMITQGVNRHEYHLAVSNLRYPADWSGANNSRMTCVACHNVHGSTQLAMVRDGKLVNREPGLRIWYNNDAIVSYSTSNADPPVPANLPLSASTGTLWVPGSSGNLCSHCHANANKEPEYRDPFQDVAQAPALTWTGETGYQFGGAQPESGPSGSSFTFRVTYTDTNNDAPNPIELWIDQDDNGSYEAGEQYAMTGADVGDTNYVDGKVYSVTLAVPGAGDNAIRYRFFASDGTVDATGAPTHDSSLALWNNVPVLSWTGEVYYESDGVHPNVGGNGATYTFRVNYTDTDNDAPTSMQVWVDANDDGTYEAGEKSDLTAVIPGDLTYSDGKLYSATMPLSRAGDGALNYRFYAADGTAEATGSPTANGTLTVNTGSNSPPALSWQVATCRAEGVTPALGAAGADFDFLVSYTDPDNECPPSASDMQVWVDANDNSSYEPGEKYNLTAVDPGDSTCSDGKLYAVSLTLALAGDDVLNYRFYASDGTDSALGTPTTDHTVTVVDAFKVRPSGGSGWYSTIQSAIDAAISGNHMVLVYEGTYNENVSMPTSTYSNTTVRSVCGPDVTTITSTGTVVFLQNLTGVVINGFQITGGSPGINSNGGSATITNCKIHHNTNSTGRGGGLYTGNSSGILTVVNSDIYSNTSLGGSAAALNAGYGHSFTNTTIHDNAALYDPLYAWTGSAGAVFTQDGSVTFTDVTITGNTAEHGNGGAVYSNGSEVNFIRSTITGNTAENGRGGAMALGNGSEIAYLENCIVADNQALEGGVSFVNGAAVTAVYSTFVGNHATAGDGGVLWQQNGTSTFRNSILWNNTASHEGHIAWFNGGSMTITDTVIASGSDRIPNNGPYFAGNVTPSVSGYVSEHDPLFVDSANGDYHLTNVSPAVDQGTASGAPAVDIDGDTRPFDCIGIGDGVDDYDIGADEVTSPAPIDSLSTTHPTAVGSGSVDADESIVMSRFQVDCDDTGDSECILSGVAVEDLGTGSSGDWDHLEIYIDTDTDITGATLIGQEASWDGSAVTVLLNRGTQADRTVTNGTPKYLFIVFDITEAAEGAILKSRVTQVNVLFPDNGATGLNYDSNIVTVNGDSLSTSNNTAIQSVNPDAGQPNVVMQRFQTACGTVGNNACILSAITVDDLGTASTGDWDSLKIYIDSDTDFAGSTQIAQTSFGGTSTAVSLDQGTVADRTVTNGTAKYIFIVYDINSGAAGKTIRSRVTGMSVQSPDNGVTGLTYTSSLLTIQAPVGGDNLSTSNPAAVHSEYADRGEGDAVMERFQVDCDNSDNGICVLSSITVDDRGTASTGDWDNLHIYIDTDTSFTGATRIGQTSSWDGTSTVVSLSLGTVGDRTVTNGTPKYVFVVYDLSASVAVDATLQSRVTALGVSSPDTGVTGIAYDSDVVTVKDAISVGSGKDYATIQAAINAASDGSIIIVSEGTYTENVNHSPPSVTTVLHMYSANGPESTIIDGNHSGSVVTLGYRSGTSTLSGFTITHGSVAGTGGAGLYVNTAQPTIDNCIITGNDAGGYPGGGIKLDNAASDVTITNTIISDNTGGDGGGLYLPSGTRATISNCVFDQNTGDLGGAIYFNAVESTTTITDSAFSDNHSTTQGGAFLIQGVNGITFRRCTITGNHADDNQYGGGVLRTGNASSDTTFENCIIAGNYAPVAGVFSLNGGDMTVMNSTVADNHATATWNGGGIAYICSGTVNMTNSIAWGNSAATGDGHNVYRTCTGPSGANVGTISYSDFDSAYGTFMYQALITDNGGNIDPATDPSFAGGGDYHLTSSSTNVIDAGTSTGAPADDIDGDARPQGAGYDMGADEVP